MLNTDDQGRLYGRGPTRDSEWVSQVELKFSALDLHVISDKKVAFVDGKAFFAQTRIGQIARQMQINSSHQPKCHVQEIVIISQPRTTSILIRLLRWSKAWSMHKH